jgi:VIT1/CCC1 family predicted Fe2+/Mn2+ transporter
MIYFLCGLLIIHGIVCLVGAFIPVYPPVFFFYAFFPGPFIIKLIIVLLAGAAQLAYGAYLSLIQKQKIRWYWPAIITVVMAGGESNRSYQRKRAVCRP